MSRAVPAVVRRGNLARIVFPGIWEVLGRRSERALGRRLKPGQVASVGMPQSSKICRTIEYRKVSTSEEAHLRELINFVLPLQQRILCQKLAKYATNAP